MGDDTGKTEGLGKHSPVGQAIHPILQPGAQAPGFRVHRTCRLRTMLRSRAFYASGCFGRNHLRRGHSRAKALRESGFRLRKIVIEAKPSGGRHILSACGTGCLSRHSQRRSWISPARQPGRLPHNSQPTSCGARVSRAGWAGESSYQASSIQGLWTPSSADEQTPLELLLATSV